MTPALLSPSPHAKTVSPLAVRALTRGPRHHFFGYYDKCPWRPRGDWLLAHQTRFMDRHPLPNDEVALGLVNPHDEAGFFPFASSRAWNWQQGAMLQWLDDETVLFNDREGDGFVSRRVNPFSGEESTLPFPVAHVALDGKCALSCNFSRLYATRPGYGYIGGRDPFASQTAPEGDGVWLLNLESGEARLILSLAKLRELAEDAGFPTPDGALHWVNHLAFNPSANRFLVLHRCGVPRFGTGVWWTTHTYTSDLSGENLHRLPDDGEFSHYDWRDDENLLAWARVRGVGRRFFLFRDQSNDWEIVADGRLKMDGHCSYSPNREWILSDEYPDKNGERALFLWHTRREILREIGRFYGPMPLDVDLRCDLHARWSRDGRKICFDSIHEGARQMYAMNLESVLD